MNSILTYARTDQEILVEIGTLTNRTLSISVIILRIAGFKLQNTLLQQESGRVPIDTDSMDQALAYFYTLDITDTPVDPPFDPERVAKLGAIEAIA